MLTATVAIGPFVAALAASPRATAAVAALSSAATLIVGSADDAYLIRALVVVGAGAFAVVAAGARERLDADRERFGLIRGAALIAEADLTTEQVIERLIDLLTPAFAERCEIDLGTTAEADRHSEHELVVPLRSRGRDVGTLRLTPPPPHLLGRRSRVRAAARRPRRARARQRRPVRAERSRRA